MRYQRSLLIAALSLSLLGPGTQALAQQAGGPTQGGPLVLQPVSNGFLVAPDVKVSQIHGQTETFAGGYGGWVSDGRLLIGGGGYGLASGPHNIGLGYGGVVIGWLGPANHGLTLSARGLLGFGETTQYVAATAVPPPVYPTPNNGPYYGPGYSPYGSVGYHQGVFVAEPEVDADVTIASSAHFIVGAGYRAVNVFHYYGYYGYTGPSYSQLSGPTASFSLQFRFW
jgi:hypothetical protein